MVDTPDQSVNYCNIDSSLVEASCAGFIIKVEDSSSLIMEDFKSIVMSEAMSLNMNSSNEYEQNVIDSVRISYVSIITIMAIIWVYDRICYIYKTQK